MRREKNIKHPPAFLICDCGQKWFPPDMNAYLDHLKEQEDKNAHCWRTEPMMEGNDDFTA